MATKKSQFESWKESMGSKLNGLNDEEKKETFEAFLVEEEKKNDELAATFATRLRTATKDEEKFRLLNEIAKKKLHSKVRRLYPEMEEIVRKLENMVLMNFTIFVGDEEMVHECLVPKVQE